MPLNIRSEDVNLLAERLAARKRVNKTEAVRLALENELRRLDAAIPLRERLRPLQDRVLARPATGLQADKAFYDAYCTQCHPRRLTPGLLRAICRAERRHGVHSDCTQSLHAITAHSMPDPERVWPLRQESRPCSRCLPYVFARLGLRTHIVGRQPSPLRRASRSRVDGTAWRNQANRSHRASASPTTILRAIRYRAVSHSWAFHPKTPATLARIEHTLETGKPLRN